MQNETPSSNVRASAPIKMQFSPDDRTLFGSNILISDSTTALYAWDRETGRIKWSALSGYGDDLGRYWPSLDGKRAAQRSYDVVKVLDISGMGTEQNSNKSRFVRAFPAVMRFRSRIPQVTGGTASLQTLALSPDGNTIVGTTNDGQLEFWDVKTGQRQLQTSPTAVTGSAQELQYSPDGLFVALFDGSTISIWDIKAGKWSTTTVSNVGSEAALAWMPDSRSLWTGSGSIQHWSVPTLKKLRDLPVGGPVAVSGDGRTLVTRALTSYGGTGGIWIWNID